MRGEGLGVRAARNRVQHGRFDFQEIVLHHEVAQAAYGFAARDKALARGLVGHQIDIALAVFHFLVGNAVELVGHGAQALGQQAQLADLNRQLAGARLEKSAFSADDVAQIPVLERGVQVFAQRVACDVQLDAPAVAAQRPVLNGGKTGLAHDALEHHAAGNGHLDGR